MDYLDSEIVTYPTPDQERLYTIYKATNLVNGKVYIGFDSNWPNRIKEHEYISFNKNSKDNNTHFHRAIRKYGKENFKWDLLYQDSNWYFTLNVIESFFIEKYKSFGKLGYNMTLGGGGTIGHIKSEKTRKMYSKIHKGKILTKETKEKISNSLKGRLISKETSQKLSQALTGHKHSEKTKEKIRNSHLGTKLSQEHKEKIRKANAKCTYEATNPSGNTKIINNFKQYCRENNLNTSSMQWAYKGKRKYKGHQIIKIN